MADLVAWVKALRAHFLTATFAPVVLGASVAFGQTGLFSLHYFVLALAGVSFIHLGANMSNDYFDYKSGNDDVNIMGSEYSGGSRVIQEGLIRPRHILYASLIFFAAGSIIGLYFILILGGLEILALGFIGVFIGYFYTAEPLRLGYRGFAELCNGIVFGPLITLGSYHVQAGGLDTVAAFASLIPGLLLALVLLINEFPDHEADRHVGKRTMVVILGKDTAIKAFKGGIAASYLILAFFVLSGIFPLLCLVSLFSVPFAYIAFSDAKKWYADPILILRANKATFLLHFSFSLLLSAGFVLDGVF